MKKTKKTRKTLGADKRGLTLIESLVGIALVSFAMMSIYMVISQAVRLMSDAKQQIGSTALATERIEYFRNQSYESIPIIDPPAVSSVERSGYTYQLETSITMVDDPENGVNAEGDYKQVKVSVRWKSGEHDRELFFVNNFVPTGITHGTVLIKAYDGESYSSLSGALVELSGTGAGGAYYVSQLTDSSNGIVLFWGLDETVSEYKIKISKSGYETLETYNSGEVSFDSIYKNITLINADDSALRYYPLRQTSDLGIKVQDEDGDDVSGIDIELVGGQKIGNDPDTYDYDDVGDAKTTDSNGEISYSNSSNVDSKMSPGYYEIANVDSLSNSSYEFVGAKDNRYPFTLAPGTSDVLELIFVDNTKDSLLVRVKDDSDNVPVPGATVRVQSGTLSYDETVVTDSLGVAFFRFDDTGLFEGLVAGDYEVDVSADGYSNNNGNAVTVSEFTSKEISLTLVE